MKKKPQNKNKTKTKTKQLKHADHKNRHFFNICLEGEGEHIFQHGGSIRQDLKNSFDDLSYLFVNGGGGGG